MSEDGILKQRRARFMGRLYGSPVEQVMHLLSIESDSELTALCALALECQWFEIAAAIKDEQKRRIGEQPILSP